MRAIMLVAAAGLGIVATPPAPTLAQAVVPAGGQQCITWRFVRQVQGYYDSSYIQYQNSCPRQVGFWLCASEVFQTSYPGACDPRRGVYGSLVAPIGWSRREAMPDRAQKVVVIRECPAGFVPAASSGGNFTCRR